MSFQNTSSSSTTVDSHELAASMTVLRYLLSTTRGRGSELATAKALFGTDTRAKFVFDKSKVSSECSDNFMFCYIDVPHLDGTITSVFTSHLDTVEHSVGVNKGIVKTGNTLTATVDGKPSILGADDGAGISVMTHMIDNYVPGRYFFFAAEESGGIGSRYAVANHPELFEGIVRAVAFDRKGTKDVISSQTGEVGCSPAFAVSLCDELARYIGTPFEPSIGVYTDTAEMFDVIDNCTNVSVGYYSEHTANESLDLAYLAKLMRAVVAIDWDSLDLAKPVREVYGYRSGYKRYNYDNYDFDDMSLKYNSSKYDMKDDAIEEILDLMQADGVTLADLVSAIKDYKMYDLL